LVRLGECGGAGSAGLVSGGVSETVAAVECFDELVGPGPAGGETESGSSTGAGDDPGGVQQGVAKPFRFGSGEVTGE